MLHITDVDKSEFERIEFREIESRREVEKTDDRKNRLYYKRCKTIYQSEGPVGAEDEDFTGHVVRAAKRGTKRCQHLDVYAGHWFGDLWGRILLEWVLGPDWDELPWERCGQQKMGLRLQYLDSDRYMSPDNDHKVRLVLTFCIPAEKPSKLPDDEVCFQHIEQHLEDIQKALRRALTDAYEARYCRELRETRQEHVNRLVRHYTGKTTYEEIDDEFAEEIESIREQINNLNERRNNAAQKEALRSLEEHWESYIEADPSDEDAETLPTDEKVLELARRELEDGDAHFNKNAISTGGLVGSSARGGHVVDMSEIIGIEGKEEE